MEWFFFLCMICLCWIVWTSWKYGITPTPTSPVVESYLINILPLIIKGNIAELGSGWGNLAVRLARHYSDCRVDAYEISPIPYYCSMLFSKWVSDQNLFIYHQDFFKESLNDYDLIVCYLYPLAMTQLKVKFEKELSPKAYVVTHTFAIPGWKPIKVEFASDMYRTPIYLYQKQQSMGQNEI